MPNDITVLHVSDLHANLNESDRLESRIDALFQDLMRQEVKIDIVVFTGDVAHAGKKEEYEFANEILFGPLVRQFQVPAKKIFVVPGNHDVDRDLVDRIQEAGFKKELKSSEHAGRVFRGNGYASDRLRGFFDFAQMFGHPSKPFGAWPVSVRGLDIGIACLNSAWRCSSDKDKGKLFLTHEQVNVAADALDGCPLRLALVHHPFDWYHPGESDILEDLKRRFEVILSGHLHTQVSVAEQTTIHNSLLITVPALYEGPLGDGYNLYRISLEDRTFTSDFRKFVRKRNEFDRDTTHARDGRHVFKLPVRDISKLTRAVMVQRLDACRTRLQQAVKQQLQVIQKVPNPVLVTPRIAKVTWPGGTRIRTPIEGGLADITKSNAIIYGPGDSGKTILLESLAADLNELRACDGSARLALYVDFSPPKPLATKEDVLSFLDAVASVEFMGEELRHAVILADNVGARDVQVLEFLLQLASERDWVLVVAVGSDLTFETLSKKREFGACTFYELGHWGPSRIREFVSKYFEGSGIDVDAAYNFVSASLKETDLPATPWVVALYLSIFPTLGKQISSLSFVRLLEKIEEHRFGQVETSSADSLYNKREILMRLACLCLKRGSISVDREAVVKLIEGFFREKLLRVDTCQFLGSLDSSGLISVSTDSVRFTYFAFYDYFLARAFERRVADVNSMLTDLQACLSVGQALCLYGGIIRENAEIAQTLLDFVSTAFKEPRNFTLRDLEKYIKDLLLEHDCKKTADQVANADLKRKIRYEEFDNEFDRRKDEQAKKGTALLKIAEPTSEMDVLGTRIVALKTFYNLFRNLENISGEQKVKFLDQILEFHINCNLSLIQFFHSLQNKDTPEDFRTVTAYIVTIGGQLFLSENIGNQSLQETILATLNTCNNDLKRLLLVSLYSDLRLPGYQKQLEDYVSGSDSVAAVELIYLQTRMLMITHDSLQVPASLISAFQAAFRKRHQLYGEKTAKGAYDRAYSDAFEEARRQHLSFFNAKEALVRTNLYA